MKYILALVLGTCGSLAAAEAVTEQIATTFGGQRVTLELSASAAARTLRPGLTTIAALINGRAVTLDGRIAIGLAAGADPAAIAARTGLALVAVVGHSAVLGPLEEGDSLAALRSLGGAAGGLRVAGLRAATDPGVTWSEPVVVRTLRPRADPTDPRFVNQWYLKNTAQVSGDVAGNDLNVSGAWAPVSGTPVTGAGVRVGVVDTGVLLTHEDLAANIIIGEGYDFLDGDTSPFPGTAPGLGHGTEVAGLIAAARNGVGVVGVAYGATIVPLRLLGDASTTLDTAQALTWKHGDPVEVMISNNSWGPNDDGFDDGAVNENPSAIELTALSDAATAGRSGKGAIVVWACGNGGDAPDTSDRDGYANSRFVIAVGATNGDGKRSYYSEMGASVFINAPVGDSLSHQAVSTSCNSANQSVINGYDVGVGTSFSTPMVCGVIALMLEARPALTWRDVRDLLAKTATKNDPTDPNWLTNGADLHWNLKYGFGRVDAAAAVAAAEDPAWATLPAEAAPLSVSATPDVAIPDPGSTAPISLVISGAALYRAETIEISLDATHPRQGQLAFTLISPKGTSVTFLARPNDLAPARIWTMSSAATWGEDPNGTWQLIARDVITGHSGTLHAVTLTVHGHLTTTPLIGGTMHTPTATPILSASGSTTIPPPAPVTPPASEESSSDKGSSCGLGAGTGMLGMLLPVLLALRLRRNLRR